MSSPTHATSEGTARYVARFPALPAEHFRLRYGIHLSSLGIGTYLGDTSAQTSANYIQSIQNAVRSGCNVIDTAINYRGMRSERDVGAALAALFARGDAQRDEVVICSKGGYIADDGAPPEDRVADLHARFFATGLATPLDIVGQMHCLTPAYLHDQITRSLENLGLPVIDVYYLHNPETQLAYVAPSEFLRRMRAAFTQLEAEVAAGRIRAYGIATWGGLRAAETDRDYLPLFKLIDLARSIAGAQHRFRFIQFPFSMGMLEALVEQNQHVEQTDGAAGPYTKRSLLSAAAHYGLVAVSSASLTQARILGRIPPSLKAALGTFTSDAQYALHFNRSTPGLTTALIGMSTPAHVYENLVVAGAQPLSREAFAKLFQRSV
jgi:aryl-alcohol dehydrogenase-like predicted oxidoreductase